MGAFLEIIWVPSLRCVLVGPVLSQQPDFISNMQIRCFMTEQFESMKVCRAEKGRRAMQPRIRGMQMYTAHCTGWFFHWYPP